jgi:antitoxin MazE
VYTHCIYRKGVGMITHIQKWGNSLSFRIPKPLAVQLGLAENSAIQLTIENGRLIITPQRYSLDDLLSKINVENIHLEVDWNGPVGNEEW